MKYTIKSTYPCVIKSKDSFVELEPNDSLLCENESILYVYPKIANIIPFTIQLDNPTDTEYFSFTRHGEEHFVILESLAQVSLTKKETLFFSGKPCQILIEKCCIKFEGEKRIVTCHISHPYKDYKIMKINGYACVQFDRDFFAFHFQKEKMFHFSGDEISISANTLTISKSLYDNLNRKRTFKVELSDQLKIENETFLRNPANKKELLSYNFLEGLKAEDFDFSISLLSKKLQTKIKKENLSQLFGEIKSIMPVEENSFIVLSSKGKVFVTFECDKGEIKDIVLDDL